MSIVSPNYDIRTLAKILSGEPDLDRLSEPMNAPVAARILIDSCPALHPDHSPTELLENALHWVHRISQESYRRGLEDGRLEIAKNIVKSIGIDGLVKNL